jgi:hypothetical protein
MPRCSRGSDRRRRARGSRRRRRVRGDGSDLIRDLPSPARSLHPASGQWPCGRPQCRRTGGERLLSLLHGRRLCARGTLGRAAGRGAPGRRRRCWGKDDSRRRRSRPSVGDHRPCSGQAGHPRGQRRDICTLEQPRVQEDRIRGNAVRRVLPQCRGGRPRVVRPPHRLGPHTAVSPFCAPRALPRVDTGQLPTEASPLWPRRLPLSARRERRSASRTAGLLRRAPSTGLLTEPRRRAAGLRGAGRDSCGIHSRLGRAAPSPLFGRGVRCRVRFLARR